MQKYFSTPWGPARHFPAHEGMHTRSDSPTHALRFLPLSFVPFVPTGVPFSPPPPQTLTDCVSAAEDPLPICAPPHSGLRLPVFPLCEGPDTPKNWCRPQQRLSSLAWGRLSCRPGYLLCTPLKTGMDGKLFLYPLRFRAWGL